LLDPFDRADDIRQANPELLVHDDDFASGDELIVHEHFERLAGELREFDDRTLGELEDFPHGHPRTPEFDGELQRYVENEIERLDGGLGPAIRLGGGSGGWGGIRLVHGGFGHGLLPL